MVIRAVATAVGAVAWSAITMVLSRLFPNVPTYIFIVIGVLGILLMGMLFVLLSTRIRLRWPFYRHLQFSVTDYLPYTQFGGVLLITILTGLVLLGILSPPTPTRRDTVRNWLSELSIDAVEPVSLTENHEFDFIYENKDLKWTKIYIFVRADTAKMLTVRARAVPGKEWSKWLNALGDTEQERRVQQLASLIPTNSNGVEVRYAGESVCKNCIVWIDTNREIPFEDMNIERLRESIELVRQAAITVEASIRIISRDYRWQ